MQSVNNIRLSRATISHERPPVRGRVKTQILVAASAIALATVIAPLTSAMAASGGAGGSGDYANGGAGGASDAAGASAACVFCAPAGSVPPGSGVPGAAGTSPGGAGGVGTGTTEGAAGGGGGGSGTVASPTGGAGGAGGTAVSGSRSVGGGGGGGGGNGINLTTNVTIGSAVIAQGGAGGAGGAGAAGSSAGTAGGNGGGGGQGGAGINVTGANLTITNAGTIRGGNGGAGGAGSAAGFTPAGVAGAGGTGGVAITGANLTVNNSGTITGGLASNGTTRANAITFTSGNNTLLVNGGTITGNIAVTGTLNLGAASLQTVSNVITGTGALVINTGQVTLTGTNTYTGGTRVANGAALTVGVDNALSTGAVVVDAGGVGGTLIGNATIFNTVTNNGLVRPGAGGTAVGTLTVGGYTQSATGTLAINASPTGVSRLLVQGPASINGALNVNFANGAYSPGVAALVSSTALTGTFSTITFVNTPAGFTGGVAYNGTTASLVGVSTSSAGLPGDLVTATLDHAQTVSDMFVSRTSGASCAMMSCQKASAWLRPYLGYSSTDASGISGLAANHVKGVTGGVDWHFESGAVLGFGAAYGHDRFSVDNAGINAHRNGYTLAIYGSLPMGDGRFDGDVYYAEGKWATNRGGSINGAPAARVFGASAQASLPISGGDILPFLRFDVASLKIGSDTETGLGGFSYQESRNDSVKGSVGARLTHSYMLESGYTITPEARVGFEQELLDTERPVYAQMPLAGSSPFMVTAAGPNRGSAIVGAGISVRQNDMVSLFADVDGRFSGNHENLSASAGLRARF